jgi:hypothetical protein
MAAREVLVFRDELFSALGSEAELSPRRRKLVNLAARASLYLDPRFQELVSSLVGPNVARVHGRSRHVSRAGAWPGLGRGTVANRVAESAGLDPRRPRGLRVKCSERPTCICGVRRASPHSSLNGEQRPPLRLHARGERGGR